MRILLIFFIFLISLNLQAQSFPVQVKAKSAVLYNPKNGAILYQKRAKEPHFPASIMKIATALYILEQPLDFQTHFLASRDALEVIRADIKQAEPMHYPPHILEHDGTMIGLQEGKKYSILYLLHGLLLMSGNDAANVLAKGISGSIPQFMEGLNFYLQRKGIYQTRLQNPHGLHHPAQMTTAYDMAVLAGIAFQNPLFCQIAKASKYQQQDEKLLINTTRFLKDGKYLYPKYIGGKTGYIASAGYNLVAAAEDKGRILIAAILGCESSDDRYEDAINLFEAAFAEKEIDRLLFSKDHECFSRKEEEQILKAKLKEDVRISYYPSEESELRAKLIWHKIKLPIKKDDILGELVIENERGFEWASASLFALANYGKDSKRESFLWLLAILGIVPFVYFYKKRSKFFQR